MIRQTSFRAKRQGFTLIEILVVLAIVAIVSSITLGGFKEMTQGNKRISCQTNLVQIYQASRLYAADEGGKFPFYGKVTATSVEPYNCATPTDTENTGIGLWSLYTFPVSPPSQVSNSAPIERYIRSAKVLHCPSALDNGSLLVAGTSVIDEEFLSYQTCDGDRPTYSSLRLTDASDKSKWNRQLVHFNGTNFVQRQPTADTIVTYCIHHRNERNMDNVLFYDGSVQLLPAGTTGDARWQRLAKAPQ